eukprot:11362216-Alexandrium_andersonii.AAC.1
MATAGSARSAQPTPSPGAQRRLSRCAPRPLASVLACTHVAACVSSTTLSFATSLPPFQRASGTWRPWRQVKLLPNTWEQYKERIGRKRR